MGTSKGYRIYLKRSEGLFWTSSENTDSITCGSLTLFQTFAETFLRSVKAIIMKTFELSLVADAS